MNAGVRLSSGMAAAPANESDALCLGLFFRENDKASNYAHLTRARLSVRRSDLSRPTREEAAMESDILVVRRTRSCGAKVCNAEYWPRGNKK